MGEINLGRDKFDVIINNNGRYIKLPWDAALMLADAIRIKAREIETEMKADRVINDQAFVLRKGLTFGLTSDPRMVKQAKVEAAHNTELRKYIPYVPMSIRSREALGTPKLIKHRRKRDNGQ